MSLILDALNRAEQDRDEEVVTPTFTAISSAATIKEKPLWLHRWPYELLLVLLLGGYFIYTQFGDTESIKLVPIQIIKPVVARAPPQEPQQKPEVIKQSKSVVIKNTIPERNNSEIQSLYTAPRPELVLESTQPPQATVPDSILAASRQQALLNREEYRGKSDVEASPEIVTASSRPDVPSLYELPWQTRRNIPSVDYAIHVHSEKSGGSIVQLNGKMRRAGEEVAAGLLLQEILNDGVILEYQGLSFKLDALNSWVNN
jgi:hypothetical protein